MARYKRKEATEAFFRIYDRNGKSEIIDFNALARLIMLRRGREKESETRKPKITKSTLP